MSSKATILPLNTASRRVSHGRSAFASELNHGQPQDGAFVAPIVAMKPQARDEQVEPEDAALTGGMRSLFRRAMGLNVLAPAPAAKKIVTPAVAEQPAARVA